MSNILVIDINPEAIKTSLSSFKDHDLHIAYSAIHALELIKNKKIDLTLCDFEIAQNYTDDNLRKLIMSKMPASEFYYLVDFTPEKTAMNLKLEMTQADGIIRRPLDYNIMQVILESSLSA